VESILAVRDSLAEMILAGRMVLLAFHQVLRRVNAICSLEYVRLIIKVSKLGCVIRILVFVKTRGFSYDHEALVGTEQGSIS
jgi:hypothetical protein